MGSDSDHDACPATVIMNMCGFPHTFVSNMGNNITSLHVEYGTYVVSDAVVALLNVPSLHDDAWFKYNLLN